MTSPTKYKYYEVTYKRRAAIPMPSLDGDVDVDTSQR